MDVGVWMGFPQSLVTLPHGQGPRFPLGSSLRNRKMSAHGKALWKQSVLFLALSPGDLHSFPS